MSGKTFFSYSRTDTAFVLKLAKDLRDANVDLWLDQLDIKAGSRWDASIQSALDTANSMIVVLSPASISSNNVMDEVSFALESNKNIIPVLLSECKVPFRLKRLQHIDFTKPYEGALSQLLEVLGYPTGVKKAESAIQQPPPLKTSVDTPLVKNEFKERATRLSKKETTLTLSDKKKSGSKNFFLIWGGVVIVVMILGTVMHLNSNSNLKNTTDSITTNSSVNLQNAVTPKDADDQLVIVPQLVGMQYSQAKSLLNNLKIIFTPVFDEDVVDTSRAYVTRQNPERYVLSADSSKQYKVLKVGQYIDIWLSVRPLTSTNDYKNQ